MDFLREHVQTKNLKTASSCLRSKVSFKIKSTVEDKGEQVVIRMNIPGFDPRKFLIVMGKSSVFVRGSKALHCMFGEQCAQCKENQSTSFAKTFRIPTNVVGEKTIARYYSGFLEIVLPKQTRFQ